MRGLCGFLREKFEDKIWEGWLPLSLATGMRQSIYKLLPDMLHFLPGFSNSSQAPVDTSRMPVARAIPLSCSLRGLAWSEARTMYKSVE